MFVQCIDMRLRTFCLSNNFAVQFRYEEAEGELDTASTR